MRLKARLTTIQYWLFLIGSGAIVCGTGTDCLPSNDQLQTQVASNVLGGITAIIDAIFLAIGNAILNPITPTAT